MVGESRCCRSAQTTHLIMRIRRSPLFDPGALTRQRWHHSSQVLVLGPFAQSCFSQLIAGCFTRQVEAEIAPSRSPICCASRCILGGEMTAKWIPRRASPSLSGPPCACPCISSLCVASLPSFFTPTANIGPITYSAIHVRSIPLYLATLRRLM
jgi:hypothetical protein